MCRSRALSLPHDTHLSQVYHPPVQIGEPFCIVYIKLEISTPCTCGSQKSPPPIGYIDSRFLLIALFTSSRQPSNSKTSRCLSFIFLPRTFILSPPPFRYSPAARNHYYRYTNSPFFPQIPHYPFTYPPAPSTNYQPYNT